MIKVAQIIGRTNNGGVENYILNYYTNIDRNKVQFDFFISNECELVNTEKIIKLGGKVYIIPGYKNLIKYIYVLYKILKTNKYDIVQANNNSLSVFSLFAATLAGSKVRIANSLSASHPKEGMRYVMKSILRPFSKLFATHFFACADYAGEWLFGKKITSQNNYFKVNNAVDSSRYQFNENYRKKIRAKYKLEDKYVIGSIGRLEPQKNYSFLIDIINNCVKKNENAYLVIIGDGKDKAILKDKIKNYGIEDNCMLLGSSEVGVGKSSAEFYSAFDVFILTSLYEGLPTVGIEAQISDLFTVFSSTITKEAKLNEKTTYCDLKASPEEWADVILNNKDKTIERECKHFDHHDINVQAHRLLEIYENILKEI